MGEIFLVRRWEEGRFGLLLKQLEMQPEHSMHKLRKEGLGFSGCKVLLAEHRGPQGTRGYFFRTL